MCAASNRICVQDISTLTERLGMKEMIAAMAFQRHIPV
jgi:hypothetical protein